MHVRIAVRVVRTHVSAFKLSRAPSPLGLGCGCDAQAEWFVSSFRLAPYSVYVRLPAWVEYKKCCDPVLLLRRRRCRAAGARGEVTVVCSALS